MAVVIGATGLVILAVADGAGGCPAGAEAAEKAVNAMEENADNPHLLTRTSQTVLDSFDAANRSILEMGIGAACTLSVAVIKGGTLRTYHAGDSEVLLTGQRGRIKYRTIPHSPPGYGEAAGILSHEDSIGHPDRHLLLNTLGSRDLRIEVGPVVEIDPKDTIVIGSDGLFDNLGADEIASIIRKGPLDAASHRLLEAATAAMSKVGTGRPGKPDDLTFILFRFG